MSDPQALHADLLRRAACEWTPRQSIAGAVRAVLELHKPGSYPDPDHSRAIVEYCLGCEESWPCQTVKVISSALGVTTDG